MRYRIEKFVDAHLPELTDLWIGAWNAAMPAIDFERRRAWFVDRLSELRGRGVEIACAFDSENGDMSGFLTLDPLQGEIDQLAVSPNHWGKGAAEALIGRAKARSKTLTLEVNQDNPRAVRFYEKNGFRRVSAGTNPHSGLKTWRYEWTER